MRSASSRSLLVSLHRQPGQDVERRVGLELVTLHDDAHGDADPPATGKSRLEAMGAIDRETEFLAKSRGFLAQMVGCVRHRAYGTAQTDGT